MAKILVIGGSGFLSGTVARYALAAGHQVWTVTRGQRALPEGVIGVIADRHDTAAFALAIEKAQSRWDLVVDCIAFNPADIEQDVAVLSPLAGHLIFVSTDSVFDPFRRSFPQAEETDFYVQEGYGGLKRQSELALINADTGAMQWSIIRPCHIYGPGSQLGCLPLHTRDINLIARLRAGEPLQLVGGGRFLQQPVFSRDLAELMLSMWNNPATFGQIFCIRGPDTVECRQYYRIIADALGVEMRVVEVSVDEHYAAHPETAPFLCHRLYDQSKLAATGAKLPATSLEQGLREHVASLLTAP
jgi:nucleoside-diphosphate-sugar epimerase